MRSESARELYSKSISSPVGRLTLVSSDEAIKAVLWEKEPANRIRLLRRPKPVLGHPLLESAERQLAEYFSGERTAFELPLAPSGTAFQLSAWTALTEIPYGSTVSYEEQARRLGSARKARAVGAANGRNPISIIVPCHRVVGKNGRLAGFAGGVELKRLLLELEAGHLAQRNAQ